MSRYGEEIRDSVFWKPTEPGETLEGIFRGTEMGKFNELLLIETGDGLVKVSVTAGLKHKIPKMSLGRRYQLMYGGTVTIEGGKSVKDYAVRPVLADDEPDVPVALPADEEVPF